MFFFNLIILIALILAIVGLLWTLYMAFQV